MRAPRYACAHRHAPLAGRLKLLVAAVAAIGLPMLFAPVRTAYADEKQICAQASEEAQKLRSSGHPKESRERLLVCVRDACPAIVRRDCSQWIAEVTAALPSVVVGARDDSGKDVVNVKVTLDGKPFVDTVDGKAVPVNPGVHTFRYEMAGVAPVEEQVVVREGEKNREIIVTFKKPPSATPEPAPAPPVSPPPAPAASRSHAPPALTYVFGAVAVAGAGVYAGFGITGKNDVDHLRSTCAPACSLAQKNTANTEILLANVGFGVGVAALVTAVVLWAVDPGSPAAPSRTGLLGPMQAKPSLALTPLSGGGFASLTARF